MLPDFSKLKSDLAVRLRQFLEKRMLFHLGPLSEAKKIQYVEGNRARMVRSNGETEPFVPTEVKAVLSWKETELPTITLEEILTRLDEAAKTMAEQKARHGYATLFRAAEKAGTTIDAKNTVMRAELILKALSTIDLDSSPDGTPRMPSIISHPTQSEGVKKALEELDRDPDLKNKFQEIIGTKREEWRVRQASRRLVG